MGADIGAAGSPVQPVVVASCGTKLLPPISSPLRGNITKLFHLKPKAPVSNFGLPYPTAFPSHLQPRPNPNPNLSTLNTATKYPSNPLPRHHPLNSIRHTSSPQSNPAELLAPKHTCTGLESPTEFYRDHIIFSNPDDAVMELVSRTLGDDQIVDEFLFSFTHDRVIEKM